MTIDRVNPHISLEIARRHLLGKSGLLTTARPRGVDGISNLVGQLGSLQMDPMSIVARSHDLVLRHRVADYHSELLNESLYEHRTLFDYGGLLAIHQISEYPAWRYHMARRKEDPKFQEAIDAFGDAASLLDIIRNHGPQSAREIALRTRSFNSNSKKPKTGSYRNKTALGRALYHLWLAGDLVTHHRDGFDRIFDLPENVLDIDQLTTLDRVQAMDYFLSHLFSTRSFLTPRSIRSTLSSLLHEPVLQEEVDLHIDVLIQSRDVSRLSIDQIRGTWMVPSGDLESLEQDNWPPGSIDSGSDSTARLLSPLDPIVKGDVPKRFFDFEHIWEIYKPESKRVYGPFTMPILAGENFVGRADIRNVVAEKTLHINGVWIERPVPPNFAEAMVDEFSSLTAFVGSERFEIHNQQANGVKLPDTRELS